MILDYDNTLLYNKSSARDLALAFVGKVICTGFIFQKFGWYMVVFDLSQGGSLTRLIIIAAL